MSVFNIPFQIKYVKIENGFTIDLKKLKLSLSKCSCVEKMKSANIEQKMFVLTAHLCNHLLCHMKCSYCYLDPSFEVMNCAPTNDKSWLITVFCPKCLKRSVLLFTET